MGSACFLSRFLSDDLVGSFLKCLCVFFSVKEFAQKIVILSVLNLVFNNGVSALQNPGMTKRKIVNKSSIIRVLNVNVGNIMESFIDSIMYPSFH